MDINTKSNIQQQPQNNQIILDENIQVKSQENQHFLQSNGENQQQVNPLISSQASTVKQEAIDQSINQECNFQIKNDFDQLTNPKENEQVDKLNTKNIDLKKDVQEINDLQILNTQNLVGNSQGQQSIFPEKCLIHDIKNKYVCIQQNCSALSRIACAECHVEGPHPKHELVKIEAFKEEIQVKSQRAIQLLEQINKESAKQQISEKIQKIQNDLINMLNDFKDEKFKLIDNVNLIGDELLSGYQSDISQLDYKKILDVFANQQVSLQDSSQLKLALILYSSEQNESVEVSKVNFQLFIEDIKKEIQQMEYNFYKALTQRTDNSFCQGVEERTAEYDIKQHNSEGVRNLKLNKSENIQEVQNEFSNNQEQISLKKDNNNNIASQIQKQKNSFLSSKEPYNWRLRRDEQKQEDEKYANQEGNNTFIRKTLQLKLKGSCIKKLQEHKGWIGRIERINENVFASCSSDKKVIFWDLSTFKPIKTWTDSSSKNHILSLCKLDSKTVAMGGSDKLIRIYEWETENMVKLLKGHKGGVNYIISLNEEVISSCGSDNSIVIWNWKQEVVLNHLANHHSQAIYQIAFLHTNSFLASCSKDTTIKVYNFDKKEVLCTLKGAKQAVHTICYLKKNLLASGNADQTIRIWNYIQGIQTKIIRVPNQSIYTLCKIDDHYIASGQSDNKIKIWAYEEGETLENSQDSRHGYGAVCVKTLESHTSAVSCLSYLAEKFTLISGSNDHSLCIWQ
ncbi:hypothetical protein ABPG72_002023 [Tetrahymena utriculariae]